MPTDIFKADIHFPERVDILAPGPNGKPHWDGLGTFTIAINKAAMISVSPIAWMVSDW